MQSLLQSRVRAHPNASGTNVQYGTQVAMQLGHLLKQLKVAKIVEWWGEERVNAEGLPVTDPVESIPQSNPHSSADEIGTIDVRRIALAGQCSKQQTVLRMGADEMRRHGNSQIDPRYRGAFKTAATIRIFDAAGQLEHQDVGEMILVWGLRMTTFKMKKSSRSRHSASAVAREPKSRPYVVDQVNPPGVDTVVLEKGLSGERPDALQNLLLLPDLLEDRADLLLPPRSRLVCRDSSEQSWNKTRAVEFPLAPQSDDVAAAAGKMLQVSDCLDESVWRVDFEYFVPVVGIDDDPTVLAAE